MTGATLDPAALAPTWVTTLFVLIVVGMWALSVAGVHAAARAAWGSGTRPAALTGVGLAAWLALMAALAARGFFHDFQSLPPRVPVVVVLPVLVTIVLLARSRSVGALLDVTDSGWLVWAQSFRILVEVVLWQLVVAHAAPEIMTFTGRNFDVAVGLTAPVIAYFCFTRRVWSRRIAIGWNVAGILVLANTVVHALLAAPTRIQVFVTDPPNTFIASLPYIWLPAFLVGLAWTLHVLSICQLARR